MNLFQILCNNKYRGLTDIVFPEHFETILINETTLSALDICEVCGSYQCPYCPYYNTGFTLTFAYITCLLSVSLLFIL